MNNPFENLPFNKNRAYIVAKTNCGCEVFVPTESEDKEIMLKKKKELQEYLLNRDDLPPKSAA